MFDDVHSDSESETTDLEALFQNIDPKVERFYFKRIDTIFLRAENITQIVFTYSYGNKHDFQSKLVLENDISIGYDKFLFCIGMTSLLWYWMGFGTSVIVIEAYEMTIIDTKFWTEFYNEILLEYKYMNATVDLDDVIIQCNSISSSSLVCNVALFEYEIVSRLNRNQVYNSPCVQQSNNKTKRKVLCPLGGE